MKPARRISPHPKGVTRSETITHDPERSAESKWTVPIVATLLAGVISLSATYWQMKSAETKEDERHNKILLEGFYNDSTRILEKIDLLFMRACDAQEFKDDATLVDLLSLYRSGYQRFKQKLDGDIIDTLDSYGNVVAESWIIFSSQGVDTSAKKGWYVESHRIYLKAKEALTKLVPMMS